MKLTRKQFLELSSRAAMGAAAYSAFPFVTNPAYAQDVLSSDAVCGAHRYIAEHKEEHIAKLQADLRQASVSSWNMGIREMADRMVESFRTLGPGSEAHRNQRVPGHLGLLRCGSPQDRRDLHDV